MPGSNRYNIMSSLFLRFLLLLLVATVPIFALTGIYNYQTASNRLKQEVQKGQQTWVNSRSDVLASQLVAEGERLETFADDNIVQSSLQAATPRAAAITTTAQLWQQSGPQGKLRYDYVNNDVGNTLATYARRFANRSFVLLADRSGALLGTTTRFWPEFDLSKFAWWPKFNSSQGIIITQPQSIAGVGDNLVLIVYFFPNHSDLANASGVLVVGLDFNQIMSSLFTKQSVDQQLPPNESAWLVNDQVDSQNQIQGKVLSSLHSDVTQLPSSWLTLFIHNVNGSIQVIKDANGSIEVNQNERDQPQAYVFAYTQLERIEAYSQNDPTVVFAVNQLNWLLVRGAPQSVAYAGLEDQLTALVVGSVLLLLAVVVVVVIISRLLLLRPIRNIDRAISAVASGDLSVRVPGQGSDELSLLGQKFNTMVNNLELLTREREQRQRQQQVVGTALQGSATELQSSAVEQNAFIAQQATTLAEIAATFKELTRSSYFIAQNSQRVAEAANSLHSEQQQGNFALRQTQEILGNLRADSENLETLASSLAQSSTAISEVIEELNNIADETKLLSLNAAIEASVEGAAGKRFAVVAEEVRELADQANTASERAQQSLSEVQGYISEVVIAIKRELGAISEGVQQSARLELLMQAITDAISKLEGSVHVIEQGTRQQRDGSATATNAIDNLAAASQQLVAQSSSVANEATKLKALSSRLQTENADGALTVSHHPRCP